MTIPIGKAAGRAMEVKRRHEKNSAFAKEVTYVYRTL
jgi:hypothetical protein